MGLADAQTGKVVETIRATRQHPFYVNGKGWVPAGGLAVGNAIVTRAGPRLIVKSIKWERRAQGFKVYNFVVQDDHTYFVGKADGGVWVHNGGPCDPKDIAKVVTRWDKGTYPTVEENIEIHYREHGSRFDSLEDYTRSAEELWQRRFERGYDWQHYEEYAGHPQIGTWVWNSTEEGAFTREGLIRQYYIIGN